MSLEKPRPNLKTWIIGIGVFVICLTLYWFSARFMVRGQTPEMAYFNNLAEAFLHGRLYLVDPFTTHDLTLFNGKWFVPFPPLPALLMLPGVAMVGVGNFNTVLFCAVMGAINAMFAFLFLQSLSEMGWTRLRQSDNLWLTVLFAVGSVHWYMSTLGTVWFVSQVCTVTFLALAAWFAVWQDAPFWPGLALGVAMLARPHVGLFFPLLAGITWQKLRDQGHPHPWRRWFRWIFFCAVPMGLAVGGLLLYNELRFGNPLVFGYTTENIAVELSVDLHRYGQFNLHFLPRNLWAMWLSLPNWDVLKTRFVPDPWGMSLLITTPALIYLFRLPRPLRYSQAWFATGAWISFVFLLIVLALYYNTGWYQFGYRFSLDFMIPLLALLAIHAGKKVSWWMRSLILVGVLVNAWGLWWFLNPCF